MQSIEGMERACFQETNRPRTPVRLTTRPDPHVRWGGRGARVTESLSRSVCYLVSSLARPQSSVMIVPFSQKSSTFRQYRKDTGRRNSMNWSGVVLVCRFVF